MSYIDRIDRLKKTIGMDVASAPQLGQKSLGKNQIGLGGPLPRANRGGMQIQVNPQAPSTGNNSGYLYDSDGNVTGWYQNNSQSWSFPGNGGGNAQPGQGGQQNVFEAMDQMNRQMNQMMRQFNSPGLGGIGGFEDSPFSIQIGPDNMNRMPGRQNMPSLPNQLNQLNQNQGKASPKNPQVVPQPKKFTAPTHDLPAYTDPNSI